LSAFIIVSMAGVSDKATIAKGQAFSNSLKNALMLNLVSEWRLDDASGTTAQDHWGANPGTWYGAGGGTYTSPSWRTSSECVSSGCLAFDGTDDYVNIGQIAQYNNLEEFTLEAWVKFNDLHHVSTLINKGPEVAAQHFWWGLFGGPANPRMILETGGETSWTSFYGLAGLGWNIDKWYHLAVVFNNTGKTVKHYRNGELSRSSLISSYDLNSGEYSIRLGIYSSASHYLKGYLDNIRIYNQAISSSQIQENYYSDLSQLLARNGLNVVEYNQRLGELKLNLTQHE
ncbi:MAG: LamG domain-containing protein, partial [Candidatus Paceibacterota bacterium]